MKPITCIITIISIIFINIQPVNAQIINVNSREEDTEIQITSAVNALKDILLREQSKCLEEIKSDIRTNNWDYEYTMESMTYDDILTKPDYIKILAAYITARSESNLDISSVDTFLTYTAEKKTDEILIPVTTEFYKEVEEPGLYKKEGTITLIEDAQIATYEETEEPGLYKKTGTEEIVLDREKVTYGEITFHVITPEEIFENYGLEEKKYHNEYLHRQNKLNNVTDNEQIIQKLTGLLPKEVEMHNLAEEIEGFNEEISSRKEILVIANSLCGQVPYLWGGKAKHPYYDTSWWTFNKDNKQNGLDCSGFVEWVYMTAGYSDWLYRQMHSTGAMLSSTMYEIPKEDLRIGDIGVKKGKKYNHTGIYAGKINGEDMWIHCSSSAGTVAITPFDFQKYYSPLSGLPDMDDSEENYVEMVDRLNQMVYSTITSKEMTEEEILLLSQLVSHEAAGEGLNGWIAVAEVVLNRMNSDKYPDTLADVIFAPKQFTNAEQIKYITPTSELYDAVKATVEGKIKILNNPECLYFKNPMITDNIPATQPVNWGPFEYYKAVGNHAFYLQTPSNIEIKE